MAEEAEKLMVDTDSRTDLIICDTRVVFFFWPMGMMSSHITVAANAIATAISAIITT